MGLFTTVLLRPGSQRRELPLKVGAIHKLSAKEKAVVKAWVQTPTVGSSSKDGGSGGRDGGGSRGGGRSGNGAVVVAGDQKWEFCDSVGLRHVDNKKHDTVPVVTCNVARNGEVFEPHFSSGFEAKRRHRVRTTLINVHMLETYGLRVAQSHLDRTRTHS